jgi:hypothetical protein
MFVYSAASISFVMVWGFHRQNVTIRFCMGPQNEMFDLEGRRQENFNSALDLQAHQDKRKRPLDILQNVFRVCEAIQKRKEADA